MKTEYKVEMKRVDSKWYNAHSPNRHGNRMFNNYMSAVEYMDRVIEAWGRYEKMFNPIESMIPRKFRIVKREVTEWEERVRI